MKTIQSSETVMLLVMQEGQWLFSSFHFFSEEARIHLNDRGSYYEDSYNA